MPARSLSSPSPGRGDEGPGPPTPVQGRSDRMTPLTEVIQSRLEILMKEPQVAATAGGARTGAWREAYRGAATRATVSGLAPATALSLIQVITLGCT